MSEGAAMTWYTASLITATYVPDHQELAVCVFEDFVLLCADSRESALSEAKRMGENTAALDDDVSISGRKAKRVFLGIRKLRSIYNNQLGDVDELPPISGSEVSHSYFEVDSLATAQRLANGERVSVEYVDDAE